MPRSQNKARLKVSTDPKDARLAPRVLLFSDDKVLIGLVCRVVGQPWKLVRQSAEGRVTRELLAQPNVRLAILDDQAVEENERGWMLAQVRKHFSGIPLLYIAADQSDSSEKRARANGAHYYASKPLSLDRFGYVLRSFLQTNQI